MNSINLFMQARLALHRRSAQYVIYNYEHWRKYSIFPFYIQKRNEVNIKSFYQNIKQKQCKYFSNCSSMKTEDTEESVNGNSNAERLKRALDDDEFQNILKDFAKDFGVASEDNKIKEDIRKQIEEQKQDNKLATDEKGETSDICFTCKIPNSRDVIEKYREFNDSDAIAIQSSEDLESGVADEQEFSYHIDQELPARSMYKDLKRGVSGVFDIDELVDVLRTENLLDVTTISVPKNLHYTDYLVLATAKSPRHSKAVIELIIKLYKKKKNKSDPFIIAEGEEVSNWKAIDMGNIVLHVFLEETRAQYDIESLWLFDSNFDSGGNVVRDPVLDILEEQMAFFNSLQESESSNNTKDIS